MSRFASAALVFATLLAAGCASQPTQTKRDARDPFERFNRASYTFNDALDRAILKPTAKGYRAVAPQFVETGVSNFFDNLDTPKTLVNDLLQGKFKPALHDTGRFVMNTTIGVGGLFDPATAAGLDRNEEDFGQTLGKWGVPPGPYLMIPFVGPATVRDGLGEIPDEYSDPRHYIEEDKIRFGLLALNVVDSRARALSLEDTLNSAYDRYAFIRNAYLQRREYLVTDGEVPEESLEDPELEDPEPEPEADSKN
jgi:phospholipid-binding lipoprotein MlaA